MSKDTIRRFELTDLVLQYDYQTHTLLCRNIDDGKNLWIRKIDDGGYILDVSGDKDRIFLSIEADEKSGQFLVLNKKDGLTEWSIPGKAYMFRLFLNYVYLIFVDGDDNFFLIKTSSDDGSKIWHHSVHDGLSEYKINNETVTLKYYDESVEILNSGSGEVIG
jgi:outer membrane protein assembly factor BamB